MRAFYQARQWQAAWDRKSEKVLLGTIGGALAHGLKPSLFLQEENLPQDKTARDEALTKAALRYADALARGYVDPKKVSDVYTIPRAKADVSAGLNQALQNGKLESWFASLPPQTDEYRALFAAHEDYIRRATDYRADPIPGGKAIKPGQKDKRLTAIATALTAIGYAPAQEAKPALPSRYTGPLVDSIKRLQGDLGLDADGIIGVDTIDALNLGPAGRARQLEIAMERLRWLQREPPETRIDVNTAATVLDYWRNGRHADRRNVVVGEPDKQTPQLQAPFSRLVANPKWRVPDSIAAKEIATKGSGWLAENNFAVENGRYVQQSGPKNSLGLVKFDMEDKQQIYLHDTPAKALFSQPERHRSHGCVRVENALEFAGLLASQDGVVPQLQKAFESQEEQWVKLKTEIPVRLLYHTVFWDGSRVQFRPDVYGLDDVVGAALGLIRGPVRKPWEHKGEDIGP
ncbi:L,D-transpeptidase family protein [Sphingomonas hankyongi]|uniref:L,D-transpeptidase family protein n=1 Tax=Sphingomonas hankyongi TaxID=2908209 RepID=A0ABT0S1J7_9SPHN|nr:L,D-transpeptidase family protein [Sphingomonas hankyongi]MCL6729611.1 L,D-transpeptidase family protein [Sphingomonas hankyongi]